jgi:serine/threonine protein kinase
MAAESFPRADLKEVFSEALELTGEERSSYLERLASDHPALVAEVCSLLEANDRAGEFIATVFETEQRELLATAAIDPQAGTHFHPGAQVGPYQIAALIGAGGMGEVYRARDVRIGREVALKVLLRAGGAEMVRRFEQEARAAGMLNHPNILTVYDVGAHEGTPFIVSELLEGTSLRVQLATRLSPRKVIDYALQVARGLAAAHEKGIVHRDLKPENIFVLDDGRVKLLDFGLVRLTHPDPNPQGETQQFVTGSGTVFGTAGYMSPEQVRGETVDHRSDIFSLGVVLHEMLTGANPFRRSSAVETLNAILNDDPVIPGEVTVGVARITQRLLEKNPSHRFQSVKDFAFALDAVEGSDSFTTSGAKKRSPARAAAKPAMPGYERLTFRRGFIMSARFAQGGSVIYGAAWEDNPLEVFTSSSLSPESRSIGMPGADVLAVSSTGELAVSLGRRYVGGFISSGTVARMPIGGAPRLVCENAQDADWSRDGRSLLILRGVEGMYRIEWPLGTIVYQTSAWISHPRISPKDDRIAFLEHPVWGDDGAFAVIIDRSGKVLSRSATHWGNTSGLAWTPKGDEVWIAAARHGADRQIYAFTVNGKERLVMPFLGRVSLHDIDPSGAALLSLDNGRREVMAGRRSEAPQAMEGSRRERNLSWFDWSWLAGLTPDGGMVLIEEQGGGRGENAIYLRPIDGGPAARIGEGRAGVTPLSPDGKWILTLGHEKGFELLPVGAGQTRLVECRDLEEILCWQLFPDATRALLIGNRLGEPKRLFELAFEGGGSPREVSPYPVTWPVSLSGDGKTAAAAGPDRIVRLFSIEGGEPRTLPGCTEDDVPVQWSDDNGAIFTYRRGRIESQIDRIDVTTGERVKWVSLRPPDPAGILDIMPVHITPDGQTYAYGYRRFLSDLYVVTGLR